MTPEGSRQSIFPDVKMLSTPSPTKASSKGKLKEDDTWQLGWWDFVPLVDGIRRPVYWTGTSTLLTAHPSQPQLVSLHFPSNKQFTIPAPPPLATSPVSYDPPSIISASPHDDWLFAYFPGKDADGVGCLWRRGPQLDHWTVKEWSTFARGAGVVGAKWLGGDREWVISDEGLPTRLPPLGPSIPFTHPVLILVTQAHIVHVYYAHPQTDAVKMLSASLCRPSFTRDGEPRPNNERVDGPRGMGLVTHSAIGLGYNEPSIIVATRSKYVPSATSDLYASNAVDLSLSLAMPPPASEPPLFSEWEIWDDANLIELCEIRLNVHGLALALSTLPLPPIPATPHPTSYLTDMLFIPVSPSRPGDLHTPSARTPTPSQHPSTPHMSPSISPLKQHSPGKSVHRSPMKGTPMRARPEKKSEGKLHLIGSFVDFGDYSTQPKSECILYTFNRDSSAAGAPRSTWTYQREVARTLPAGVIAFLAPAVPFAASNHASVLAGVLELEGVVGRRRGKDATIGKIHILNLSDLTFNETWQPSDIRCNVGTHGVDPPFSVAVSPNRALVCTVSSSTILTARTCIQQYPLRRTTDTSSPLGASKVLSQKHLPQALALAVHKRTMASDVVHSLCRPSTPVQQVEETLEGAWRIFEADDYGLATMWTTDLVGVAVDVYRNKFLNAKSDELKEDLCARWQTGQDVCFMAALSLAWDSCIDGDGYDLEAVWQLLGVSGWFIEFLENLMKECVLFSSDEEAGPVAVVNATGFMTPKDEDFDDDLFGSGPPLHPTFTGHESSPTSSTLLHIVHPFALGNMHQVLNHVKKFRTYLGSLPAGAEIAQIAKEVLLDLVDCSGVNLDVLDKTISDFRAEEKGITSEHACKSLAAMRPSSGTQSVLRKFVSKITESNAIDRPRLFIKPSDLVDGMLGLSITKSAQTKENQRDVVSKGILPNQRTPIVCLRCNGRSELGVSSSVPGHIPLRWATWERAWISRCICGGLWSNSNNV